ncbi:MAG: YbdD/YjiX family protein [Pseudomonadota bacterium]
MSLLGSFLSKVAETGQLMVGQSSYRAYLAHMAMHHPHARVMDERAFFRSRQEARYCGRNGGRCC